MIEEHKLNMLALGASAAFVVIFSILSDDPKNYEVAIDKKRDPADPREGMYVRFCESVEAAFEHPDIPDIERFALKRGLCRMKRYRHVDMADSAGSKEEFDLCLQEFARFVWMTNDLFRKIAHVSPQEAVRLIHEGVVQ